MKGIHSLIKFSNDTGCYNPFDLADLLNVDVVHSSELPQGFSGLAVSDLSVIFIDEKYHDKPYSFFICAHELTHTIEDNGIQGYYNISNKTKNSIENKTNRLAISLLVHFYFNAYEITEFDQIKNIMNTYGIPDDLNDMVFDEVSRWKSNNTVWWQLV